MSISPMSSNVYNNMGYGAKAESPKKPAGAEPASVQPREEAPVASDTVELSAKKPADDTSATPALDTTATTTTTPPQAGFPVVPVAVGGGVGAIGGGLGLHAMFGDDSKEGGKVKIKDDKLETVSEKITAEGKTHVIDTDTGLKYEIKEAESSATMGDITGTIKVGNDPTEYTYVKGTDKPSLTTEFHVGGHDALLGAEDAKKATLTVTESGVKITPHADHAKTLKTLEFKLNDKGVLERTDALTTLIGTEAGQLEETVVAKFQTHLESLKLGNVAKELKEKLQPKGLSDLVKFEEAGGLFGRKINWAIWTGAAVVGLAGAAAGFFLGKKPAPAPDASTVS